MGNCDNYNITVMILTYNSSIEKTFQTIDSVIKQKKVNLQIVIADDGSLKNNFEEIESYLRGFNFFNYKLVSSKHNQGILKNYIKGLMHSDYAMVKPLSPGDFLYNEESLYNALRYIDSSLPGTVYFGKLIYYGNEEKELKIYKNYCNPYNINPFIKQDYRKIKRNYFIDLDFISGASLIFNKEKFLPYLIEISKYVKYAEDYALIEILAYGEKIIPILDRDNNFMPFVWYECNTGISTSSHSKWKKILDEECYQVFKRLTEKNLISKGIFDLQCAFWNNNPIRILKLLSVSPIIFFTRLFRKITTNVIRVKKIELNFLVNILDKKYFCS